MEEVSFEVETVTPLFIAGADQRNIENEGLRPPSLKGLLRWWFRAVMGGMVSKISELRSIENSIFGGKVDSKAHKSKVSIIMGINKHKIFRFNEFREYPKYLWFTMKLGVNRYRQIILNGNFEINIRAREKTPLDIATGALWMLIYLGGVGTRSRRGAGCIRIKRVIYNDSNIKLIQQARNIKELKEFYENSLDKILKIYRRFAEENKCAGGGLSTNFCILSNNTSFIGLFKKKDNNASFLDVLKDIEVEYMKFRKEIYLKDRRVLGLPIRNVSMNRFASPVIFGVTKLQKNYIGRYVKFYTSVRNENDQNLLEKVLKKLNEQFVVEKVKIP
ncbi:MAG: type III-B CRISPR module RAMP protein Cmr1 [Candidatus Asgardarchaeia archaeon]